MLGHRTYVLGYYSKGFDEWWLRMIHIILSSGFSSVLLKGVPGKKFPCKRGVRQGDPLSPILFIEGVDLLQYMVNHLAHMGLLTPPLPIPDTDFSISSICRRHLADFEGLSGSAPCFERRDFYFRALRSLVVLIFPQPLSFSSVFPSL
jgi:hypothetical protein